MQVVQVVNPLGAKTWLPVEFWQGIKPTAERDGLQETGKTGELETTTPWTFIQTIHAEAKSILGE